MTESDKNLQKQCFHIDGRLFSPKNPLIIAELGTSHNGDIKKAKEMISAAAETGADCVKFQIVYADEILSPNTGIVPLPVGNIRLYDKFKALEMPAVFYEEIKEYTEKQGLLFLCTPFGMKSAALLKKLEPKMVKIASPELNYTSLLEEIATWNLPILLSSGVSRLSDIEDALDLLRFDNGSNSVCANRVCLLHCVTSYPAPETDYNLKVLPNLSNIFDVPVGISDHSAGTEIVASLAVSLGALVIEKHFCLSRKDPGLDDPIALPVQEFSAMVKAIRNGAGLSLEEKIAYYNSKYDISFLQAILGDGVKKLAPCEKQNYRLTNRSIHALRNIKAGEILTRSDYAVLRTEKVLRPGLPPSMEKTIEGRVARNDIPEGEGIRFEDI